MLRVGEGVQLNQIRITLLAEEKFLWVHVGHTAAKQDLWVFLLTQINPSNKSANVKLTSIGRNVERDVYLEVS